MAGAREKRIAAVLGNEIRVAMVRRRVNALQLSRLAGISNSTLGTLLNGSSAMDVDQLARICKALDLEPGELYSAAIAMADDAGTSTRPIPPVIRQTVTDPRTLLQYLLDNPDEDDELNTRLANARQHVGEKSSRSQRLAAEIRQLRRTELERALNDLPPTTARVVNGGNQQ